MALYLWAPAVLFFLAIKAAHADPANIPSPDVEFELRAAVVIGILRFSTQYGHEGSEYPLCLIGSPPSINKVLLATGISIGKNRTLHVRAIAQNASVTPCAAIVMGPDLSADSQIFISQQATQNSSILICDNCSKGELAHVRLQRKDERIAFAVDIGLAQESQITFSSKFLSLAVEIRR